MRPKPTRAPRGEAMALCPHRSGGGGCPGGGRGPHAQVGRWRYGRGHSRRGTPAAPRTERDWERAKGLLPSPPPSPLVG